MRVLMLLTAIVTLCFYKLPVMGAISPASAAHGHVPGIVTVPANTTSHIPGIYHVLKGRGKFRLKEKLVLQMLKWKAKRQIGGDDQPTERQRKFGRLSLIFGLVAIVVIAFPYSALAISTIFGILALPLAVAGLVLGIKSIQGNSNVLGLIGTIVSGSLLALFLIATIFLALFFSGGWI